MAHLKVYENTHAASNKKYPYLLDIQSNLLDDLRTTVVIPVGTVAATSGAAITKLCPIIEIKSRKFVVFTQQLAGVDKKVLGKEIADLTAYRSDVIAALDFLISGI